MILVGELALWVALLMAAWGAIVSFAGGSSGRPELVASGARALYATFACLVLASAGVLVALVTSDFSLQYVATVTSANLPIGYKLAGLWAGQAGALLSWALILSMYAAITVAANQMRNRSLMPYVAGTLSIVLLFFIAVLCFVASPYERMVPIPAEGRGMHPELQHPAMAIHPPTLNLGYAATTIPFAFAIAALMVRQIGDDGMLVVRRWGVVSWSFMTLGIITGGWWVYVGPGGQGVWPLSALSFAPWLVAAVFLHIATRQARRGTVRTWNVLLIMSAFLLAFAASFVGTRGALAAIDPSAPSDVRGWAIGFLVVGTVGAGYLMVARLRTLRVTDLEAAVSEGPRSLVDQRVRLGRYTLYGGIVVFLVAAAGFAFTKERDVSLGPGEVVTLVDPYRREWTFTSQGLSDFPERNRAVEAVPLRATRDATAVALIVTERRQYVDSRGVATFEPSIEAGIEQSLLQDIYVVMTSLSGDRVNVRIAFHPLMVWTWIGGVAIAIGGAMVMWPAPFARGSRA